MARILIIGATGFAGKTMLRMLSGLGVMMYLEPTDTLLAIEIFLGFSTKQNCMSVM